MQASSLTTGSQSEQPQSFTPGSLDDAGEGEGEGEGSEEDGAEDGEEDAEGDGDAEGEVEERLVLAHAATSELAASSRTKGRNPRIDR